MNDTQVAVGVAPDVVPLVERLGVGQACDLTVFRTPKYHGITISDQIRHLVIQDPVGFSSFETLAAIFCVSQRTLTRRLTREGITFRSLLNEVKLELAKNYLNESNENIRGISKRLGYGNASNFTKAFKRWSGLTPHRYRLKMRTDFQDDSVLFAQG